jgi:hypothetical protein
VNFALTGLSESSPSVADALHVTVVVPIGKVDPDAGLQLTGGVWPPSSVAVDAV